MHGLQAVWMNAAEVLAPVLRQCARSACLGPWSSGCCGGSCNRALSADSAAVVPIQRADFTQRGCLLQVAAAAAAAHAAFLGLNTLVVHRWRLGGNDEPESYLYEGSAFDEEAHQAQGT